MDRDFDNSVILGYGPTEETHCGACKGNHRHALSKGFAFHCRDNTSGLDFVAGTTCRAEKMPHDSRPLSAIPHFGAAKPIPVETGRKGRGGGLRASFAEVSNDDKLIADMSAWVQLRQKRLPALGFAGISYEKLDKFMPSIAEGRFTIAEAREVKRTYDSITKSKPKWALENLQKCHDVAMQIARVETNPETSASNRGFLSGIKSWLTDKYFLTPDQVQGLNNVAKYRGEPEWTTGMKFV